MKKVIRLTERDLTRIVRRVINEQIGNDGCITCITDAANNANITGLTEDKAQKLLELLTQGEMPTQEDITSIVNVSDIWKLTSFGMALMGCQSECMSNKSIKYY